MKTFYLLLSLGVFFISSQLTAQQTTYIPDSNFEQALIDLGHDNVMDNYVTTSNIISITDLDINFKDISDLTGIASFTGLRSLKCAFNNLISLDLSKNTALTYLDCGFNKLDVLDVSNNKALTAIYCDFNNLVDLKVNNGNNTNFTILDASRNASLNCIDVDNAAYSTANWFNKDATSSYCDDGAPAPPLERTYVPDNNFEKALIALGYDDVLDDYVSTSNISGVTVLDVSDKGIADLTGIESFSNLSTLYCSKNNLTRLDVSQNTKLSSLKCTGNQITSLDVSQNRALAILSCSYNQLSSLDVSQNTALSQLYCAFNQITNLDVSQNMALIDLYSFNNQLTRLDLRNDNNVNITNFDVTNNPDLACIEVDDAAYSNSNWVNKDTTSSYCDDGAPAPPLERTYVPDNNFEKALIALGYDDVLDNYVSTSNISGVTVLNVYDRGIADLTGIASFENLTTLYCSKNNLTRLDVSQNTKLTSFYCTGNQLTSLDVSQNIALVIFSCSYNQLSSLDVSQNRALSQLYCAVNQITNLDVSQNMALIDLYSFNNQLTRLDLRNDNNVNITNFDVTNNPDLACIEVDDAAYSNSNWLNKDTTSSYSMNCEGGGSLFEPLVRISTGGNINVTSTDQGPDWEANPDNGSYTGASYAVNTGNNYSSGLQYANRDVSIPNYIDAATFAEIFKRYRSDTDLGEEMEFTVPLANGNYTVNLYMGNYWSGSNEPGERVFDILIEGSLVEDNMDLVATFGHRVAGMVSYQVTVTDGILNIAFGHEVNNPLVSAIEIMGQSNSSTSKTSSNSKEDSDTASSTNQLETSNYKLYPNPVKDILNIALDYGFKIEQVNFYNAYGQRVLSAKTSRINVNNLQSGVYFVEIETNQGKATKKIIVK